MQLQESRKSDHHVGHHNAGMPLLPENNRISSEGRIPTSFFAAAIAVMVSFSFVPTGCEFDPSGIGAKTDYPDAWVTDASYFDSTFDSTVDAQHPDADTSCTNGTFECLSNGHARICRNGTWFDLGHCPMGCIESAEHCRVPSNVPADIMADDSAHGIMEESAGDSPIHINTDNGEIRNAGGIIRSANQFGTDSDSGIAYTHLSQSNTSVGLGVFVLAELIIGENVEVVVTGSRALVLLVNGEVSIKGVFDLTGSELHAGPGGFNGGNAGEKGFGPCSGFPGQGVAYSDWGCSSGGGGGGHMGNGGNGGHNTAVCPTEHHFLGGNGGDATCSTPELIPLIGGSGGAGGSFMEGNSQTVPGGGGGGGGAIQISSSLLIHFTGSGSINTGGGGGGETNNGGGSGGGSGGAILLEAPDVYLDNGVILAANGGGGGGGDCS